MSSIRVEYCSFDVPSDYFCVTSSYIYMLGDGGANKDCFVNNGMPHLKTVRCNSKSTRINFLPLNKLSACFCFLVVNLTFVVLLHNFKSITFGKLKLCFHLQMSTMPGLPTRPCIYDIDLDLDTGDVKGLF